VLPLSIPNYPVFLFTGLLAWGWFSSAVGSATTSAIDRRELLLRPGLSRTVVPVVSVLTDLLDYLVALPVLLVVLVLTTGVPPTALLLPVVLAVQLLVILGFGFALCCANVYLRDVRLLVDLALLLGFYLTPVFYRPGTVPHAARLLVTLNPMAHLIEAQRDLLVGGHLPPLGSFALVTLVAIALFAGGLALYRRASATFVDEL
jgi:lipopolysaccharide transport system permease protein